jgi:hypothetical protein
MHILFFLLSVSGSTEGDWLNPLDILPPSGWAPDMLQVSSNHAGDENIKITVFCRIEFDLSVGNVATLIVPGYYGSPFTFILPIVQLQGSDNIFLFSTGSDGKSITNPVAGVYGPISLVVTQSLNGQIIASSNSFFEIAIIAAAGTDTLTVAYKNTSSTVVNTAASLTFSFTLGVVMNQMDYLVLFLDENWPTASTLSTPAWNMAAATNAVWSMTSSHYAPMTNTTHGTYTIYGLPQVFLNTTTVMSFTLSGFTNPPSVIDGFSWELKAMRFGTATTLRAFSGAGTLTVTAGTITGAAWALSNN